MSDGRHGTYARLFAESATALRRYVRRLVGSNEDAEEIVQEAFLRTYERADTVDIPRAFLFTTAKNLAANEYRHRRLIKTDSTGDFDALDVVSESATVEEQALADEWTRLLVAAVDRLPPQCRAAFTLRVFHDCSYKEIARRLGLAPKTVEKYIAHGLHETHGYLKRQYQGAIKPHG